MRKTSFNGQYFTFGNRKIGNDTAIFNTCPSLYCPSRLLGLCQLDNMPSDLRDRRFDSGLCYALKAERVYPAVLPYRIRQSKFWQYCTSTEFINALYNDAGNHKFKYLRLNECGDIHLNDIKKLKSIAKILYKENIILYMYTARKDLLSELRKKRPDNLIINGSGFMVDNLFQVISKNKLEEIKRDKKVLVCKENCRICNLCKRKTGSTIYNIIH